MRDQNGDDWSFGGRKFFSAMEVHCDVCKAEAGEECTYWYGSGRRRAKKIMHGCHAKRSRAAEAATEMFNTLVNS